MENTRNRPAQGQPSPQEKDRKNTEKSTTNPQGKQTPSGQGTGAMHQGSGRTDADREKRDQHSHPGSVKR